MFLGAPLKDFDFFQDVIYLIFSSPFPEETEYTSGTMFPLRDTFYGTVWMRLRS